jgi:putative protease
VEEDEQGTYIFNAKDLCLLNKLPQLIKIGVDSLKIEGRMKSVYYVGAVVRVYRAALDYIATNMEASLANKRSITLPPVYREELMKIGTRGYTENFIFSPPGAEDMLYDKPRIDQEYVPVGIIKGFGNKGESANWLEVEVRNPLRKGETAEYLGRDINAVPFEVLELLDQEGIPLKQANPGNFVRVRYGADIDAAWEVNCLLRKKK